MATLRYDVRIDRPADDVWAIVTDSSRLNEWFDGISSVDLGEDSRTLHLEIGIDIVEQIVTNDDVARRFQYSITEGLPDAHHLGTVDVLEDGDAACRVVYSTEIVADFVPIVGPTTEKALQSLKARAEG